MLISVVMFSTLVFGLIEGRIYGWWNQTDKQFSLGDFVWPADSISVIPVALAIFLVSAVAFVRWELRREKSGKNVILDLNLFSITSFRNGSIAAGIISMGEFGILFALPLWLQNVLGLSPISSGLVLLWLAAGAFFPWFGWLINPAFAGVAMAASSITVVTNANRLRFFRLGHDHVE